MSPFFSTKELGGREFLPAHSECHSHLSASLCRNRL